MTMVVLPVVKHAANHVVVVLRWRVVDRLKLEAPCLTVTPLEFLVVIWLWKPVCQLTENSRQLDGLDELTLSACVLLPRDCEKSLAGSGDVLVELAELVDLLDHGW